MNISVKDKIGLNQEHIWALVNSLFYNRPPKTGSYDYGFETHGAIGISIGVDFPIQVFQSNKRTSEKSPIVITIERHKPLF